MFVHKFFCKSILLKIINVQVTRHIEWYAFNVDDNKVFQKWLKQFAVLRMEFDRKYNASVLVRCIVERVNRYSTIMNYLQIRNVKFFRMFSASSG
jgi:hypothetical protein